MDAETLLAHLIADGPRMLDAARSARWDTTVASLGWTVRELMIHTGAVQRWSADIVARRLATNETGGSAAFRPDGPSGPADPDGLADADLGAWFADGHRALVDILTAADPDLDVWTFGRRPHGQRPREFWIRRQVHELAVHRADAELAAGLTPDVDADLAQDGIAEVLGFGAEGRFAIERVASVGLDALDGASWLLTTGDGPTRADRTEELAGTDVTVRGLSGDLYLWLWNRPADVVVDGDADAAALWTSTVRI